MQAARREPIIISDAVYTRYAIQHDKSVAVNCLVLFMTNWNKVKMSCGQTQPVVLRRGIRFRHGSLFCHQASGCVNSSSAARALCGIGIAPYVATFLVNIFHLPRSYSYLANLEKSSPIHTWSSRRLRWREFEDTCTNADGWHEWRWFQVSVFSIWFPNKVHRSSRNKYAECRINSRPIFLRSNLPI